MQAVSSNIRHYFEDSCIEAFLSEVPRIQSTPFPTSSTLTADRIKIGEKLYDVYVVKEKVESIAISIFLAGFSEKQQLGAGATQKVMAALKWQEGELTLAKCSFIPVTAGNEASKKERYKNICRIANLKPKLEDAVQPIFTVIDTYEEYLVFQAYFDMTLEKSLKGGWNHQKVAFIAARVLTALDWFQKNDLVHRDIKLDNILANVTEEGDYIDVCLADFDVAVSTKEKGVRKFIGNTHHVSPEMLSLLDRSKGRLPYPITSKSDVWAFGNLCFYLLFGRYPPWVDQEVKVDNFQLRLQLYKDYSSKLSNKAYFFDKDTSKFPPQLIEGIKLCFSINPANRPSPSELLSLFDYWTKWMNSEGDEVARGNIVKSLFVENLHCGTTVNCSIGSQEFPT